MAIVSSTIIEDARQRDGRRHVCERHVDHLGGVRDVRYMAESGADATAILPTRAAQIEAELAAEETAQNLAELDQ